MKINEIISRCETLYNDLDFAYVKEWKEKTGKKAVGHLPIYVPKELIYATGMLPVGVMGAGDQLEIIKGDAFFQSYICHIPRSVTELAVTGRLDAMDGFLFPAICDVIRNLSGMFKILLEDKYVKYMDYPQNFSKEVGGDFYTHELNSLLSDLAELAGVTVSEEDLVNSINLYNENRQAISRLYRMRSEHPEWVPSYENYLLMRASNILEVTEHTQMLNDYMEAVQVERAGAILKDNVRVVVSGAFCEQPPLALIKSLEMSGCYIIEDDFIVGARFINGDIETSGDPVTNISTAYIEKGVESASRYEPDCKGQQLLAQISENRAEGVIFAAPSFCDPALLERPMLQKVLSDKKIPYTALKYSENSGQFQVIKEQAGTFADSIKLWGEA